PGAAVIGRDCRVHGPGCRARAAAGPFGPQPIRTTISTSPASGAAKLPQGLTSARRFVSVQLRLRLRLVPVRPCRYVLELRLEEVVQELLLRVLHLREDLSRSRRPTPHREFA